MTTRLNTIKIFIFLIFTSFQTIAQIDENVFRDIKGKNGDVKADSVNVMDLHLNFNADWRFSFR